MSETKTCPKCEAELPADAPGGICPKCLMLAGLASEQDAGSAPDMEPTTHTSRFVPPAPEELAKHFPQLEILELLGKGGMGAVYKARQPGLDRLVAVKILPPEVGTDPDFAERFKREARALAKLSHQNIVSVFDFGQADGLYYFIMEYVDGANLRHVIKAGAVKPEEALAIVPQICEALQFAHDEGIVHRDIKPENILVDKQGRVKIADFGLAKLLGKAAAELTLTGTHQVMGTPHYMAPEQMQGAGSVDHRADIYSLGVVFYEMLTGQLPIGRFEAPSKKVQIDVQLDEVVLRSLESEPDRRYQNVSEVKTDIETITRNAAPEAAGNRAGLEHREKPLAPGLGPRQLLLLIMVIFSLLSITAGVVLLVIVVLNPNSSGWLWGGLGGSIGCIFGGGGALIGMWIQYRRKHGAGDLMQQPGRTWLDTLTTGVFLVGLAALATTAVLWPSLSPHVRFIALVFGGTMTLEAAGYFLWRWAVRRAMGRKVGSAGFDPRLVPVAIQMVLGFLAIAAGVVLLAYGVLVHGGSPGFGGWMGAALGCIGGGAGTVVGGWNVYRRIEGSGDLMETCSWTWFDWGILGWGLLGLLGIVAGLVLSPWLSWWVAYTMVLLGGILVFQGALFLLIRGLARRAARQETAGDQQSKRSRERTTNSG